MPKASDHERKKVDAVERALSILDVFSASAHRLSLAEISKLTGLYPSTILRLAGSLEYWGYLRRDDSGMFRLGPTPLRLGTAYQDTFDLGEVIRPALRRLSESTGETSAFYVREADERVCLYRQNSSHSLRHHMEEGVRLPLDRGAGGHVLSAYTGEEGESLEGVREDGFSISFGERDTETAAVSVPLLGRDDAFVGALTLVGPRTRIGEDEARRFVELLKDAAAELHEELDGHRAVAR